MLLTRHASRHLASYCDGQLATAKRRDVEAHLAACARCRAELEEIRFAAGLVRQLASVTAPASVWTSIEQALSGKRGLAPFSGDHVKKGPGPFFPYPRWAVAALVLLIAGGGTAYWYSSRTTGSWEINRLDDGSGTTRVAAGEWIETGQSSRARIKVGEIGTVVVEPGTRVQLGAVLPAEYRIALARGTISARIVAPPRFFFVETPASTVVDLGCAYTMQVDDTGGGELRMTEGWASLEWEGRESLVPAGAQCRTRPGVGPGTPYFDDAPAALQQAVTAFDFEGRGTRALDIILAEARARDTLTLWHLLSRVAPEERGRVYDRIAELSPPPGSVTREKALQLDRETLTRWREELAWIW